MRGLLGTWMERLRAVIRVGKLVHIYTLYVYILVYMYVYIYITNVQGLFEARRCSIVYCIWKIYCVYTRVLACVWMEVRLCLDAHNTLRTHTHACTHTRILLDVFSCDRSTHIHTHTHTHTHTSRCLVFSCDSKPEFDSSPVCNSDQPQQLSRAHRQTHR